MNNGDAMVTTAGEKHTVQLLFCGKWIRRLDLHPLSELIHRFGCSDGGIFCSVLCIRTIMMDVFFILLHALYSLLTL